GAERIVMLFRKGTRPHENGRHRHYPGLSVGLRGKAVFCLVPPARERIWPDLGSARRPSNPTLSPPLPRGARRANCSAPRGPPRTAGALPRSTAMHILHPPCAGLDVHKAPVKACCLRISVAAITRQSRGLVTDT